MAPSRRGRDRATRRKHQLIDLELERELAAEVGACRVFERLRPRARERNDPPNCTRRTPGCRVIAAVTRS
ncbi:MAG: hypothetical protein ACJ76I_08750 [Gaiellaceae bacterium]